MASKKAGKTGVMERGLSMLKPAKGPKTKPAKAGSSKKNVDVVPLLKLEAEVVRFVKEHRISCPEVICQNDDVIVDAYEFIENLVDIVGYYDGD